jgi:hypothetical protein
MTYIYILTACSLYMLQDNIDVMLSVTGTDCRALTSVCIFITATDHGAY